MRETPGPAVEVIDRAPAHPAPRTIPTAACSSSACTMAKVALPSSMRYGRAYSMIDSQSDDEGVLGYHVTAVTAPKLETIAAAALPSMMILPSVGFIRSMCHFDCEARCSC